MVGIDGGNMMKKTGVNFLFLLALLSSSAFAALEDKAIYGDDNRLEAYEATNPAISSVTKSVAAQVYNSNLEEDFDLKKFLYSYPDYGQIRPGGTGRQLCKNERFINQPAGINCTGFLIAENKMLTAGHCVTFSADCEDFYWVFDFKYASTKQKRANNAFKFSSEQLVRCTKVIKRAYNGEEGKDYAIVELDRKITDRPILKLRKSGKVSKSDTFAVVGFPGGVPMKVTVGAKFRENTDKDVFKIDSDTFHGNSGSPVINEKTGEVEGVLVRGDTDYEENKKDDCRAIKRFKEGAGRGEDIVRILSIMKDE